MNTAELCRMELGAQREVSASDGEEEESYLVKVGIIGESACSSLCRARHREERSAFRRRTPETTSRLSVSGPESASSWRSCGGGDPSGSLRRGGSRESIRRLARPSVPQALSLSKHSMSPRITQESYRLQVSDRTMGGALATVTLASFGNRRTPSRQGNEITGWERASPVRRGRETRPQSELGYSFIASARSTCGAGCHDENPPGTEVVKYAS